MGSDNTPRAVRVCKADPPGWHHFPNGRKERYPGGVDFGKPCCPVIGLYDGHEIFTCRYCGRLTDATCSDSRRIDVSGF